MLVEVVGGTVRSLRRKPAAINFVLYALRLLIIVHICDASNVYSSP
jgi:hypothetical protein